MGTLQACPDEDDGIDIINGLTIVNKSGQTIYYDCFEVSKTEINSIKPFFSRLSQLPDNSSYKRVTMLFNNLKPEMRKFLF